MKKYVFSLSITLVSWIYMLTTSKKIHRTFLISKISITCYNLTSVTKKSKNYIFLQFKKYLNHTNLYQTSVSYRVIYIHMIYTQEFRLNQTVVIMHVVNCSPSDGTNILQMGQISFRWDSYIKMHFQMGQMCFQMGQPDFQMGQMCFQMGQTWEMLFSDGTNVFSDGTKSDKRFFRWEKCVFRWDKTWEMLFSDGTNVFSDGTKSDKRFFRCEKCVFRWDKQVFRWDKTWASCFQMGHMCFR